MPGPMELMIILVIVAMLFGVGRLPEIFGAVGKGIREFRHEVSPPQPNAPVEKSTDKPNEKVTLETEEQQP